jgi:hypothetical protein
MKILNIEIPPTLNCNKNQVQIVGIQIQNSRYKIVPVGNKPQVYFQFKVDLTPTQHSELENLISLAVPTVKCVATITLGMPEGTGNIQAQLSYNGSEFVLNGNL